MILIKLSPIIDGILMNEIMANPINIGRKDRSLYY